MQKGFDRNRVGKGPRGRVHGPPCWRERQDRTRSLSLNVRNSRVDRWHRSTTCSDAPTHRKTLCRKHPPLVSIGIPTHPHPHRRIPMRSTPFQTAWSRQQQVGWSTKASSCTAPRHLTCATARFPTWIFRRFVDDIRRSIPSVRRDGIGVAFGSISDHLPLGLDVDRPIQRVSKDLHPEDQPRPRCPRRTTARSTRCAPAPIETYGARCEAFLVARRRAGW